MPLILYVVSEGPPSIAVRQALKYLELEHTLVNMDYRSGDHMTEEYARVSGFSSLIFDEICFLFVEKPPKGDSGSGRQWIFPR